jgi:hypothetical protein
MIVEKTKEIGEEGTREARKEGERKEGKEEAEGRKV